MDIFDEDICQPFAKHGHLRSRSTEASRSVEEPDPPVPPAAETDTVAAAATAVPSAGPVPSLGPQVFHMASDESQDEGAGEDSDGDFFPDFPVRKEPEASANLEESSWMAQDVKMADDAQPQTQAAGEEEPQQQRFENSEGASTFSAQPPVAPEKLSEPEPASAQPQATPPASDPDPTLFTDPEKAGVQRIYIFVSGIRRAMSTHSSLPRASIAHYNLVKLPDACFSSYTQLAY